jgi:hypothetical protein
VTLELAMTSRGRVRGGVVVLDKPLPEGSEVEVTLRNDAADVLSADQSALLARGRELVRRARERNEAVPAAVIEREVAQAVDEVRHRGAS